MSDNPSFARLHKMAHKKSLDTTKEEEEEGENVDDFKNKKRQRVIPLCRELIHKHIEIKE